MKAYPLFDKTLDGIFKFLDFVVRERKNDVNDFINLKNNFISGRKVGKIPMGAADIDVSDRVGDFNYDTDFIYIVVDNSGTAEWRKVALINW
jgi:hypothetical protein